MKNMVLNLKVLIMCYVLTEDGNNEIDFAKPVKIY